MTLPASGPGRLLERSGDAARRGMTVAAFAPNRTRLIGWLRPFFPAMPLRASRSFYVLMIYNRPLPNKGGGFFAEAWGAVRRTSTDRR